MSRDKATRYVALGLKQMRAREPRKILNEFLDRNNSLCYNNTSLSFFNNTGISSVEWLLELSERKNNESEAV